MPEFDDEPDGQPASTRVRWLAAALVLGVVVVGALIGAAVGISGGQSAPESPQPVVSAPSPRRLGLMCPVTLTWSVTESPFRSRFDVKVPNGRGGTMAEFGLEPERLHRVSVALAVGERDPSVSLCVACAEVVGVQGAGLALVAAEHTLEMMCVSDAATAVVEEVQYALGEGPCVDAYHAHAPIMAEDLAASSEAWPGFREGALRAGISAAFGFPLMVQGICIGALNLYHDRPGHLTREQVADATAVSHVAARTVMGWQVMATPGSLAPQLEQVPTHRAVVHQATGMVSVQADVSVDDALVIVRAYAFAHDEPIGEVADAVVSGTLRFD